MANATQARSKRGKMAERAQRQMDMHFRNYPDAWLWKRTRNDGYTTIPRTMPIVMQAINAWSKSQPKSSPAGHTLFCLWARSPDHSLITIENPLTFAAEAGFSGSRAADTWRKHMKTLHELSMIDRREGISGEFHYVLLLNPNVAIEQMHQKNQIQNDLYTRFKERIFDIGAQKDLDAFSAYQEKQRRLLNETAQ